MRKIIIAAVAFLVALFQLNAIEVTDTTFMYQNKTVVLNDSAGKITVKVRNNDSTEVKQVYEGVFSNEKSVEKWTVMEDWGINLPILDKLKKKSNKKMEAHWAGLGWGFANIADNGMAINNLEGISLRSEKSNEFYFNPFEKIIPISGNNLGITTGLGFTWRNYHLDNNQHLQEVNHVIEVVDATPGVNYKFSRFRTFGLSIPLLLEFQNHLGTKDLFFLSAGIVGNVNTYSSYRLKYTTLDGGDVNKVVGKGLNINPLTIDYMAQIGYGSWSIYAKYSPISIFQSQKGPQVNHIAMGATLNF